MTARNATKSKVLHRLRSWDKARLHSTVTETIHTSRDRSPSSRKAGSYKKIISVKIRNSREIERSSRECMRLSFPNGKGKASRHRKHVKA